MGNVEKAQLQCYLVALLGTGYVVAADPIWLTDSLIWLTSNFTAVSSDIFTLEGSSLHLSTHSLTD